MHPTLVGVVGLQEQYFVNVVKFTSKNDKRRFVRFVVW